MPKESKPIVLIADDEASTVAMLSSHLQTKGFTVLEASDGDEAWELAHEHLPNLVLLDVMMPGMSGWEVCRKIREAVSLAHTGVIMLTGIGENLNEMTSPLYGADAYLDKPFEFSDLDQKISETIARRSAGALGRADGDSASDVSEKKVGRARGKAAKPAEEAPESQPKANAPQKAERAAASKKAQPAITSEQHGGPKPALAKAVARPAPKLPKAAKVETLTESAAPEKASTRAKTARPSAEPSSSSPENAAPVKAPAKLPKPGVAAKAPKKGRPIASAKSTSKKQPAKASPTRAGEVLGNRKKTNKGAASPAMKAAKKGKKTAPKDTSAGRGAKPKPAVTTKPGKASKAKASKAKASKAKPGKAKAKASKTKPKKKSARKR